MSDINKDAIREYVRQNLFRHKMSAAGLSDFLSSYAGSKENAYALGGPVNQENPIDNWAENPRAVIPAVRYDDGGEIPPVSAEKRALLKLLAAKVRQQTTYTRDFSVESSASSQKNKEAAVIIAAKYAQDNKANAPKETVPPVLLDRKSGSVPNIDLYNELNFQRLINKQPMPEFVPQEISTEEARAREAARLARIAERQERGADKTAGSPGIIGWVT